MSKSKPTLSEIEFNELVKNAIAVAKNYYDRTSKNGSYQIAKELNSEVGYNFYYYANYLEDLIILNHYLIEGNIDLLGFYNLMDIEKIFGAFKDKYIYQGLKKNSVSLYEFLDLELPNKRDDTNVNFLSNLDYHEIINREDEDTKLVENYKKIEKDFRSDIIDYFSDRIIRKYTEENIDVVSILDKMIDKKKYIDDYKNLNANLVNKNISNTLLNINEFFNYGFIEIDIYGNISLKDKTLLDSNIEYYLVKYINRFSLIIKDKESTMTHYYAEKNKYLEEYLKSKNFKYKNDFNYGINSCCKILEICLIFIIYFNLKTKNKDLHFKCLDYSTVKTILLVLSI